MLFAGAYYSSFSTDRRLLVLFEVVTDYSSLYEKENTLRISTAAEIHLYYGCGRRCLLEVCYIGAAAFAASFVLYYCVRTYFVFCMRAWRTVADKDCVDILTPAR